MQPDAQRQPDKFLELSPASLRRVGGVLTALLLLVGVLRLRASPLGVAGPHHIVLLFAAGNYASSASSALQLWSLLTKHQSSAALSVQASRLAFGASLLRAVWSLTGHAFRASLISNLDVVLSVILSGALALALSPSVGPSLGVQPARLDEFPAFKAAGAAAALSVLSMVFGLSGEGDEAAPPDASNSLRWVTLACAIYTQMLAVLPMRAALARAKRVEALTSHAVACLAVGAVFRVLMWLLLMLEGEFHMLLAPRCPTLSDRHLRARTPPDSPAALCHSPPIHAALLAEEEAEKEAGRAKESKKGKKKKNKGRAGGGGAGPSQAPEDEADETGEGEAAAAEVEEAELAAALEESARLEGARPVVEERTVVTATEGGSPSAAEAPVAKEEEEPPADFICPITTEIMVEPVVAADGQSYERTAIERWLATKSTSPLTGGELEHSILIPNHNLRRTIREWQEARASL
ncbi:hypothetical protein EMIHUDRAFT_107434 [Emiliania huxleyi CCMP1516]|uniref:U-box domain-containing protein n=4 Tax=Emiliania huxleyi TaxID=2903 RepID=A0A0D3I128_EMIH1|nr:hypothetical protein EMIHUDRAFT_107434 [Emiliania huxleyi CCMP1516]EOD04963.1 hypothetical protein EMIHUDRAFT_107434 [Emiliania huxleyi CCMP1516]|eukprot:XP_005757392.1 hypothetical protein EMIHUDRAFT_107434 [Emiliania huxleyi CCMP1516]